MSAMTADTISTSKMLLTNKNDECLYLGVPKYVKHIDKGFSVKWAMPTDLPAQAYPYDRAVLFTAKGDLITTVRIVPTLIPDNVREISLTLNP